MKKRAMSLKTDVEISFQCEEFVRKYGSFTNEEFEQGIEFFEEGNPVVVDKFLITCAISAKENNWTGERCNTIAFMQFIYFENAVDVWFKENYKEDNLPNITSAFKAAYVCALAEGLNTLWGNQCFTPEVFAKMYSELKETVRGNNNKVMFLNRDTKKDDLGLTDFLKQSIN